MNLLLGRFVRISPVFKVSDVSNSLMVMLIFIVGRCLEVVVSGFSPFYVDFWISFNAVYGKQFVTSLNVYEIC